MIQDLQKASMWKRISAWLFDGILFGILAVAAGVLGTWAVMAYLPWLLLAGLVTGFLTGAACAGIIRPLKNAAGQSYSS